MQAAGSTKRHCDGHDVEVAQEDSGASLRYEGSRHTQSKSEEGTADEHSEDSMEDSHDDSHDDSDEDSNDQDSIEDSHEVGHYKDVMLNETSNSRMQAPRESDHQCQDLWALD